MVEFDDRDDSEKEVAGSDRPREIIAPQQGWVEQYLSSLPVAPSGFQVSSVIMIVTRLEGSTEGQLSREEIVTEINNLGVERFIDKYTEDRRFFSKKTGTAIKRPDPELLRRAAELRATGVSGTAQGMPRRSVSTSSLPAVNIAPSPVVPTTPVPSAGGDVQPGSLLAGVRKAAAGVFSALTSGRAATGKDNVDEGESDIVPSSGLGFPEDTGGDK